MQPPVFYNPKLLNLHMCQNVKYWMNLYSLYIGVEILHQSKNFQQNKWK